MSILNHAGMSHEARLAQAYEEISAICRDAIMDRYASADCRAMAGLIKKAIEPVFEVACALDNERKAGQK